MDEKERREQVMSLRRQNEEAKQARDARWEQAGGERAYREQTRPHERQRGSNLAGIRWENLGSWRIWIAAALIATLPAVLAGALNSAFGFVVFFAIIGVSMWAASRPTGPVMYCPYCKKRVKMGAASCHHCGRIVA